MGHAVARQRTVSGEAPGVDVLQTRSRGRGSAAHYRQIKVDEAAVVGAVALSSIHTVGVVAHAARRAQINNVAAVEGETVVAEDAFAAVATIAQCVGPGAFRREIVAIVVAHEQGLEQRAVRSVGARATGGAGVVAVMAIRAGNDAAGAQRCDQTDHVIVASRTRHRMK